MAVDSKLKRHSAMLIGLPFRLVLPPPDGTVDAEDRQVCAGLYSGISARAYGVTRAYQHYEDKTRRRQRTTLLGTEYKRLYRFPVGAVSTLTPARESVMPGESGIHAPRVKNTIRAQEPNNGMIAVEVVFLSAEAYA